MSAAASWPSRSSRSTPTSRKATGRGSPMRRRRPRASAWWNGSSPSSVRSDCPSRRAVSELTWRWSCETTDPSRSGSSRRPPTRRSSHGRSVAGRHRRGLDGLADAPADHAAHDLHHLHGVPVEVGELLRPDEGSVALVDAVGVDLVLVVRIPQPVAEHRDSHQRLVLLGGAGDNAHRAGIMHILGRRSDGAQAVTWPNEPRSLGRTSRGHLAERAAVTWPNDARSLGRTTRGHLADGGAATWPNDARPLGRTTRGHLAERAAATWPLSPAGLRRPTGSSRRPGEAGPPSCSGRRRGPAVPGGRGSGPGS